MHYPLYWFFHSMLILHILHILHALPPAVVFQLGVQHYHITYITCITPSVEFAQKLILHIYYIHYPLCWFFQQNLYYIYYMHYPLYWFFHSMLILHILHILHALPPAVVFQLGVQNYHITHIICITPSAEFAQNRYYIYYMHYPLCWFFQQNPYYIYYMHNPLCWFSQQNQYYIYYMHYPLYWFFYSMLILHILHILHALPPEVVFQLGVQHYHITHITCIYPLC